MIVVYTAIVLSVLIFAHELGHFGAAKLSKIKVNEFALGMGPAIFKRQRGETVYALRAFPIGGFCAMEGENGDSEDEKSFDSKPMGIRAIVLAAGSFMNVVLAILIMTGIILYFGTSATTTLNTVTDGSPAQLAGILPGDRIVSVGGVETDAWEDIVKEISGTGKDSILIGIVRGGNELMVQTDIATAENGRKIIGISPKINRNPFAALVMGTKASYGMIVNTVDVLRQLFTGEVPATEMTSIVGIAVIVDETAKIGMLPLLDLVALISLNLAIVNMLPFPALDGGRLVFLVIRKATGRAVTDKMEATVHMIGFAMLIALMLFVTWNDIGRLVNGTFPGLGGGF